MGDIFLVFSMKDHLEVREFEHDDEDDDHEDDDDDDHDRRRRRLKKQLTEQSSIFRKDILINIEKIQQEIEVNEKWRKLCLADPLRNHECSHLSLLSPIQMYHYRNGTSALGSMTQREVNKHLRKLIDLLNLHRYEWHALQNLLPKSVY